MCGKRRYNPAKSSPGSWKRHPAAHAVRPLLHPGAERQLFLLPILLFLLFRPVAGLSQETDLPRGPRYQLLLKGQLPDNWYLSPLENGLRMLVIEDPTSPMFNAGFGIRASNVDYAGQGVGAPEMFSALWVPATHLPRNRREGPEFLAAHNLDAHAYARGEHLGLEVRGPAQRFDAFAEFLQAAVFHLKFDTVQLIRRKVLLAKQRQRQQGSVLEYLEELEGKLLWGKDHYLKTKQTPYVDLRRVTLSQVRQLWKERFFPNDAFLVVSGNVEHSAVFSLCDSLLGQWSPPAYTEPTVNPFEGLRSDTARVMLNDFIAQPVIRIAWQLPDVLASAKRLAIGRLLAQLIASRSGPFYQNLVATGLASDVQARFFPSQFESELEITIYGYEGVLSHTLRKFWLVTDSLRQQNYLRPEWLAAARKNLKVDYHHQMGSNIRRVTPLLELWAHTGVSNMPGYLYWLNNVKTADLRTYISRGLIHSPAAQVTLLSSDAFEERGMKYYLSKIRRFEPATPAQDTLSPEEKRIQYLRQGMLVYNLDTDTLNEEQRRYNLVQERSVEEQLNRTRRPGQEGSEYAAMPNLQLPGQEQENTSEATDSATVSLSPPRWLAETEPEAAPLRVLAGYLAPFEEGIALRTAADIRELQAEERANLTATERTSPEPEVPPALPPTSSEDITSQRREASGNDLAAGRNGNSLRLSIPVDDTSRTNYDPVLREFPGSNQQQPAEVITAETLPTDSLQASADSATAGSSPTRSAQLELPPGAELVQKMLIRFPPKSTELTNPIRTQLTDLGLFLTANTAHSLVIRSGADNLSADQEALALERAHHVKRYLVNHFNISPLRLEIEAPVPAAKSLPDENTVNFELIP